MLKLLAARHGSVASPGRTSPFHGGFDRLVNGHPKLRPASEKLHVFARTRCGFQAWCLASAYVPPHVRPSRRAARDPKLCCRRVRRRRHGRHSLCRRHHRESLPDPRPISIPVGTLEQKSGRGPRRRPRQHPNTQPATRRKQVPVTPMQRSQPNHSSAER